MLVNKANFACLRQCLSYKQESLRGCLQEAAMKLKVGLSVLKRICRQMGLARWPFRTRQSLRGVISKTHEYFKVCSLSLLRQRGS